MARRGRVIDFKTWVAIASSFQSVSTNTTLAGNGVTTSVKSTILRCRGFVQATMDSTAQIGDVMQLTFGLGLVSSDAFAVGAISLPDPGIDVGYPWLWWGQMKLESEIAAGADTWGPQAMRLEVDTKAMRRWGPDMTLAWVCNTEGAAGAPATLVTFGQTRVLIGT